MHTACHGTRVVRPTLRMAGAHALIKTVKHYETFYDMR